MWKKTIRKIQLPSGSVINGQSEILKEVRKFYEDLFKASDNTENLSIPKEVISKIKRTTSPDIGHNIEIEVLGLALKGMKNNKSPGIDGISVEFLKVFWNKLKYFVKNTINVCHRKGKLSTSLRKSVISCIPKGNKDRKFLKNWRPISLLCVVYKLASTVIANRLKPDLETIISKNQTGFLKGRRIEEGTRLVYDIINYTEKLNKPGLVMLIDFQKAFDSVSWQFLLRVLEIFGYDEDFISWIQLFNEEIEAYVIQCGILSKPISIQKGCRQGDPIAPYLFILVTEILTLMIEHNPNIKGITVGQDELKLSQFADDTTILLDGTTKSLQATLNVLEIYGNLSGLKINKEKTKLIWIGSKKNSVRRLIIGEDMCWGENTFNLMGLQFSVNLNDIPHLNFDLAIQKAKIELKSWKYRTLSPIGKITVLKTLILPKFVHLFSSIPVPQTILTEINTMFYNFLWDGNPDKVKRNIVCKDYSEGGMKMINVLKFEKAQKLKWLKYCVVNRKVGCVLLDKDTKNLENITTLGGECISKYYKASNLFWKVVFTYWADFCASQQILSTTDILSSSIWFNKHINTENIYFSTWSKKGINFVNDIIDTNGNVLPLQTLKEKYGVNINFLHYYTISGLVQRFISKYHKGKNMEIIKPYIPFHLTPLIKSQQNKKAIYQSLCTNNEPKVNNDVKWIADLEFEIDITMWKSVYKACFFAINDNTIIWLQYRIMKRILGTNHYLKKTKISDSDACRICHKEPETLVHLFFDCSKVTELWLNIKNWIKSKTDICLDWNKMICILGYSLCDANFYPLNFILMIVRQYIFKCALKNRDLNIYQIQRNNSFKAHVAY